MPYKLAVSTFRSRLLVRLQQSLPIHRVRSAHGTTFKIFGPRLVVWLLILLSLLWFVSITSVYFYVKHKRGFADVRLRQVAGLPFTLDAYRRAQGEFYLKEGRRLFAEKNYVMSFELMRAGLRTVPEDRDARRFVIELYLAIKRSDLASAFLEDGLAIHSHDPDYVQFFFDSLLKAQEDSRVVAAAERLLEDKTLPSIPRYQAIMAAATACFLRAHYLEAERWLSRDNTQKTEEGGLLLARIFLDQGNQEKGLAQLNLLEQRYPANERVYSTHLALLRQLGRTDEARRLALAASLRSPDAPRFQLDLLQLAWTSGKEKEFGSGFDSFLATFGTQTEPLNQLAALCATNGAADSARRVYDLVRARDYPWLSVGIGLVESLIVAGRHAEALDAIQGIEKEAPDWLTAQRAALDALRAIALFGTGDHDQAETCLLSYLNNRLAQPDQMVICATRLEALHGEKLARSALVRAVERDPRNQAALQKLLLLDLRRQEADALPQYVERLLELRRPPTDLLAFILGQLESDIYIFLPGREKLISSLATALQAQGRG